MTLGDRLRASGPIMADNAFRKSPVEMPFRYRTGNSPSRLTEHRAHFGNMVDVKRIFSAGSGVAIRSRSLGRWTSGAPIPVWICRCSPNPCRTIRCRPSSRCSAAKRATNPSASAFSASASIRRAPSRASSVKASTIDPDWRNGRIVVSFFIGVLLPVRFWVRFWPASIPATIRRLSNHAITHIPA